MTKPTADRIAGSLKSDIAAGRFAVGTQLPTEFQLCEQYSASRYAVRGALAELEALGLVTRRKNVGTTVVCASPKRTFRPSLASIADLIQFGSDHVRRLGRARIVRMPAELAGELDCPAQGRWLRIDSLRVQGNAAAVVAHTEIYIDPAYADVARLAAAAPAMLVSDLIEREHGRQVDEIVQSIQACTIDDDRVATALQVARGAPGLRIVRRYLDADGILFEATVTVHPADRFAVTMRLKR